ncbi:hypothetical protein L1277_000911 [Okibacterium sp. HSC-33S16]|uniref:PH-like domain-containing protein n=1 Tax=Okibacterium sp. HSC-33S16 TaxID=2910965 RepID=UPI0020A09968|nr:hypothetical protein [Okibacterium sp. HSC-33S16]MCP2030847.1 hypothetical protein [Okibacterium sp. HSC-33S16]
MSDRLIPAILVLGLLALLLVGMWLAWRGRVRRHSGLTAGESLPDAGIHPILVADVLYVATTEADRPLERLAIRGLAFRARAELTVATEGVVISVPGQEPIFLPAHSIRSSLPATWTIDRVVESDGLVAIAWRSGETDVDSYVRVIDSTQHAAVLDALASLTSTGPDSSAPAPTTSTERKKS